MQEVAPGVFRHPTSFVNVYLVGEADRGWTLVDAGVSGYFESIRAAAEERFGPDTPPTAIVLTHGHQDHVGAALALATYWDVPIYAHALEMPYLTGRSLHPPKDPTVGGAMALLSRFFPPNGTDLGKRVRPLPEDGTVPGMPGWHWIHVPGHAPGQVALWREADRTLLAGDAFATMNLDSAFDMLTKRQEIARPAAPFTCDWVAARRSMYRLAELKPLTVACGHGVPMSGPDVAGALLAYTEDFVAPLRGRYVVEPAVTDETGVVELPPPAPDPLPKQLAAAGAIALVGVAAVLMARSAKEQAKR